jgi:GAF domain-containing protein
VLDDVDRADDINPILREKGVKSLLGVPLVFGNRVLGVLHVGTGRDRWHPLRADPAARA